MSGYFCTCKVSVLKKYIGLNYVAKFRTMLKYAYIVLLTPLPWFALQKWKQLSRLQRSLILFALVLLLIGGVTTYPSLTAHWGGVHVFIKLKICADLF